MVMGLNLKFRFAAVERLAMRSKILATSDVGQPSAVTWVPLPKQAPSALTEISWRQSLNIDIGAAGSIVIFRVTASA
ncbi:hypothetical protein BM1_06403 [Bipolaris maydis]|nr:hypothetical protein BM1_06403 [Bipolaris maydis]